MPERTVFSDQIPYRQICDPEGRIDEELCTLDITREFITDLYRTMVLCRTFDQKSLRLQRQGRLGTYAPFMGQEASQVGSVFALDEKDVIFPSYRESAVFLVRGVPIKRILQYWGGDERGNTGLRERGLFPIAIPVGSQAIHAVGASRARMIQGTHSLTVTYFGDGATSEGDVLEAMNFAGVWDTPVLFFCQNNQWAISVPRDKQTASQTLAQKALAFGFPGVQIDGNDPLIVYQTVNELRERALEEQQPFLIETLTYRMGDHTTSDDSERYRPAEERERWKKRGPIRRIRRLMERRDWWSDERERELREEMDQKVREGVQAYLEADPPDPLDMFRYTYEEPTPQLDRQIQELREELGRE